MILFNLELLNLVFPQRVLSVLNGKITLTLKFQTRISLQRDFSKNSPLNPTWKKISVKSKNLLALTTCQLKVEMLVFLLVQLIQWVKKKINKNNKKN